MGYKKCVSLVFAIFIVNACVPNYIEPDIENKTVVNFIFIPDNSRNAVSVFDEHETCKGKNLILDNKKQDAISIGFEKTDIKSFDVYSLFDQVYTGINFQSSICRYMFSMPLKDSEYEVVLSSGKSGCNLVVSEVTNEQKNQVDIRVKEITSNPDTFASSSHCK